MRKQFALLASLLLLAPSIWAAKPPLTPDEKSVLECSPGVVLIVVSYKIVVTIEGRPLDPSLATFNPAYTGTGFLYRPDGYIVTNAHVIEYANLKDPQAQEERRQELLQQIPRALDQRLKSSGRPGLSAVDLRGFATRSTTPQIDVYLSNKEQHVGEIKVYSDPTGRNVGKDVAVLKIDATNLPTVKLGNSDEVRTGDALRVIGYPGAVSPLNGFEMISRDSALVPTFTSGHVSALKRDYKGTPVIQSDAAITHGNSGGPAFNADGEVVGIATYATAKEIAGLNFFVPINTALEFVRQSGSLPESGPFDLAWSAALDAYQEGKWETAKHHFADALTLVPDQPDVERFLSLASEKSRTESLVARLSESYGTAIWASAAGVLVLLIGLIGFVLFRSRPTPLPAALHRAPVPARTVLVQPAPSILSAHASTTQTSNSASSASFGTLRVTGGSFNGNVFPIPQAGLLIGRDSSRCAVVVPDDTVSKEHAWVVPLDREVVLIDRGSSNGTYVNSIETPGINKVTLKNGDRVFIGKKGAAVLTFFSA